MRNRAPGEDDVVAELIKYGGPTIVKAIYKLIVMVWEKEIMPECLKTGIICPIFKKGHSGYVKIIRVSHY
jgi:hypothetical protein